MNLYFDSTATTRVCPQAIKAMKEVLEIDYGNPSSKHFQGMKAEDRIVEARKFMAKTIKAKKDEIYFTSGGTESNNLAVQGVARAYKRDGRHIITTSIEHPSVGSAFAALEEEGFKVSYVKNDEYGFVDLNHLEALIGPDTMLVSIMQVNNEIGTIQSIESIGHLIKKTNPKTLFHIDGVQGFMKFPIDVKKALVDLYSASSHKIRGPKGMGFLYVKQGLKIRPLLYGGSQQKGIRPGTENVPGIVGFYAAAKENERQVNKHYEKVFELKDYLLKEVSTKLPEWKLTSPLSIGDINQEVSSPYIISLRSKSLKGEVVLHALEDYKICVSTGSACSSKKLNVSHVLKALGINDADNDRAIRISVSYDQGRQEIDTLIDALVNIDAMFGRFVKK